MMKNWVINFSIHHAVRVYWLMAVVTFGLAAFIPTIQIDTDPENMLPATQEDRVFHNEIKKEFALYDAIVVGLVHDETVFSVKALNELQQLTQQILTIEGVVKPDVMSLETIDNITQGSEGVIRFEWMMNGKDITPGVAKAIEQAVSRLPLTLDTLVSGDGKAAAIYVPILDKNESYRISQDIQSFIDQLDSELEFHMTGLPVAEDTFGFEMFVQMGISAPLAAVMIFVLMLFFFRNVSFVVAPMIVAMATVISTMGLLIACGFTVHIMSSMIAIFLMPIAVVDSVHIMSEFADRYKPGESAKNIARQVVDHLFTPMLFTSVTSAIGFFSLTLTPIPPVQIFGVFVGFGILLAFFWTIIFMPAYISRMSEKQLSALQTRLHSTSASSNHTSPLTKLLGQLKSIGLARSKTVIVLFIGLLGFSVVGIQKIEINDNPVRWFKDDHRIRVADHVLNEHFAGTYDAFLVLTDESRNDKIRQFQSSTLASIANDESLADLTAFLTKTSAKEFSITEWISVLDERMFSAASEEEVNTLEGLMKSAEQLSSELKRFTHPEMLATIEKLQQALDATQLVGKSNAVTDLIKTVNRELFSGNDIDYRLPDSQAGVAQTLLQYQSSHRPNDLWHMVNPEFSRTVIWMQLTSGDNQAMSEVIDQINAYIEQNPLPDGVSLQWAGKTYINVVWQEAMVAGMLDSLMSAFVVVLVMMVLLFRSIIFGVLAMLPLTLTIAFIYGLIGWIGKDYDMPIAVLSALTLGLSVDFAIHFIERTRSLFKQTGSFSQTMTLMFDEPGRAISRNAIVIAVGFTPLLFAPLVPYITVGVFLASIMAASAIVTLLMLPALMNILKSWIFSSDRG